MDVVVEEMKPLNTKLKTMNSSTRKQMATIWATNWVANCSPILILVFLLTPLVLFSGCAKKVDEVLIGHRKALMKNSAPEEFTSIESAQQNIKQSASITIEGRADLKEMDSHKPRAMFLVREVLEDDGHGGSGHDPSSCPFCKRRLAAAPKAVVVFLDDQGDVIPYDVESLFSIEHGDVVIIEGEGKLDEGLNLFKVVASSVFIRQ